MNTNTSKLKTTFAALSLITASVFTVSAAHAATEQVQTTAVDFEGVLTTSTVQICALP